MAKKTILTTTIPRKKDFLYYCGTDSKGNITIGEVAMKRSGKRKRKKKK